MQLLKLLLNLLNNEKTRSHEPNKKGKNKTLKKTYKTLICLNHIALESYLIERHRDSSEHVRMGYSFWHFLFANRTHSIGRSDYPGRLQRHMRWATTSMVSARRWCLGSLILGQHKHLPLLTLGYVGSRGVVFICWNDWQVRRSFRSRCSNLETFTQVINWCSLKHIKSIKMYFLG